VIHVVILLSCPKAHSATEFSPLSLHDALPIFGTNVGDTFQACANLGGTGVLRNDIHLSGKDAIPPTGLGDIDFRIRNRRAGINRSAEHTSELQSRENLVCRLLLEKKKKQNIVV